MTWLRARARGHIPLWIVLILLISAFAYQESDDYLPHHAKADPLTGATYYQLGTPYAGVKLFGLQSVRGVVHSQYLYEAALINSTPVDDIDYLTPYASQELVTLPGFTTDKYIFRGAVFIAGSGIASCWIVVANGGHFCLLHLSQTAVRATSPPVHMPGLLNLPKRPLSGDEMTALAIGRLLPPKSPQATVYHGGFAVGHSGWPSSYQYSNGSCYDFYSCESDAHLCFVLDAKAATWFYDIFTGKHKKPAPPFPQREWDKYSRNHHKAKIPAYINHHLKLSARWWWHYKKRNLLGSVESRDHYYGPTRARKHPFTETRFAGAWVACWPDYQTCEIGKRYRRGL